MHEKRMNKKKRNMKKIKNKKTKIENEERMKKLTRKN